MFRRILVPLDGSALAERALPYATRIASAWGGRIILVQAITAHSFAGGAQATAQMAEALDAAKAVLQQRVDNLRDQGIEAEVQVYADDPVTAISRAIDDLKVDLVAMSTHGRSGLPRVIYGSTAEALLQHIQVPALLIPLGCEQAWSNGMPLRVLLPLDGSLLSEKAIPVAAEIARMLPANLVLLRVVGPPAEYEEGYAVTFDPDAALSEARDYLSTILKRPSLKGVGAERVAVAWQPAAMICMEAQNERAAAVIMATHAYGGFDQMVLGSVTRDVLHGCKRPLFVIPS